MTETRLGRQTPTQSVTIPYSKTRGQEAAELYAKTGNELLEWQQLLQCDIMAVNDDGLWMHQKYGYSVPRRNGKSENVLARCLWGLKNGERILYTAHRATTSHAVWERLDRMCEKAGIKISSSFKAFGKEHLYTSDGGVVEFRTRTSSGGLGEGYDVLIIDEAQEYTEAQETSLKYIVSDSENPQTIMLGTPPTAVSAGTVFTKYRETVLAGRGFDSGWAEWSVENLTSANDVEAWYETNPSLGTILTERKIRAEITTDDIDFNIQRLGLWLKYNQKSAISKTEWESLAIASKPKLKVVLFTDSSRTSRMIVQERGQTIATYKGYTAYDHAEIYTGQIYGVVLYKEGTTTEERLTNVEDTVNQTNTDLQMAIAELTTVIATLATSAAGTPQNIEGG